MADLVGHYINGEKITPSNPTLDIYNPATAEVSNQLLLADKEVCDNAVQSSLKAFPTWAATPLIKRGKILFNLRNLLEKHQNELQKLITQEHGKTRDDAKGEIMRAIEVVELHTGILTELQGSLTPNVATDIDCYTFYEPLGVVAGVSPFNFPIMVPVWMLIPAIACGNTFILKPSEQDPSAPMFLMELLHEAKLPDGVVNLVNGNKQTVDYLLENQDIQAFTAVASTPVAEYIYTKATSLGKRAQTFGGAKNHAVIMPDCDINKTAAQLVGASYGSAGERCMAISVAVTVGEGTTKSFLEAIKPLIQKIRIDAGENDNVDMGPLISKAHLEKVKQAIATGIEEGAELIVDGRDFSHNNLSGYFLGPSLFANVTEDMSIYQNEIFGPVLIIVEVQNLDEAIALINRNQYGNGTAIFTNDGFSARKFSQHVSVGMVGINVPIPVPIASHPFGGFKNSAFGDIKMHGKESILFYTKRKTVTARWLQHDIITNSFNMPVHD